MFGRQITSINYSPSSFQKDTMYCLVVIVTEILLHLLILENAEDHEVYLNYLKQSHLLNFESYLRLPACSEPCERGTAAGSIVTGL